MAERIDEAWLRERDLRRHDEAKVVLRELQAVAFEVPEEHAALYCAVVGSTYRMLDQLEHARDSLRLGLKLADELRDPRARANLLQRWGYVELHMLRHDRAVAFAEQAFAAYHFLGDDEGKGQTLVDRGGFLVHLNRTDDAIASYAEALDLLDKDSHLNRFSALHALAWLHGVRKREIDQARTYIERAHKHLPELKTQKQSRAKLIWLDASLDRLERRPEAASGKLMQVVALLTDTKPIDAVLAGLELAEVHFVLGGPQLAHSTVGDLLRFVQDLEETPAAKAAVEGLLQAGKRTLTLERIRQTRKAVVRDARLRPGRDHEMPSAGG